MDGLKVFSRPQILTGERIVVWYLQSTKDMINMRQMNYIYWCKI